MSLILSASNVVIKEALVPPDIPAKPISSKAVIEVSISRCSSGDTEFKVFLARYTETSEGRESKPHEGTIIVLDFVAVKSNLFNSGMDEQPAYTVYLRPNYFFYPMRFACEVDVMNVVGDASSDVVSLRKVNGRFPTSRLESPISRRVRQYLSQSLHSERACRPVPRP